MPAPVAGSDKAELPLDHPEHMFHPCPDKGMFAVALLLTRREILFWLAFVLYAPAYSQLARTPLVFVTGIARITKDDLVLRPQQLGQNLDVGFVGSSNFDTVHRP